jgi:uncharacterized membrane protein (UPF0127 family)
MTTDQIVINGVATGIPVVTADACLTRLRGFIGARQRGYALFFPACTSIHTCFMGFPLSVVFLDCRNRVVRVIPELKPWRFVLPVPAAAAVLEYPCGLPGAHLPAVGDTLTCASLQTGD